MVSILAALVSLVVGLLVGKSELLLIVLAGLVLVGFFYKQVGISALLCFLSVLAINAFIAHDYFNFFFYIISIVLVRYLFGINLPRPIQLIWVPLLFALGTFIWQDQSLVIIILAILFVFSVPIKKSALEFSNDKYLFGIFIFIPIFMSVLTWTYYHIPRQIRSSAILDNGNWAKTDIKYSLSNLDISSSYSYSEFKELLGATSLDIESLGPEIGELWVITPTAPFSDSQKLKLLNWVKQGGHLIILTDHTDLFGHGRVANSILEKFGMFTNLSATFSYKGIDYVDDSLSGKFKLMTGTSIGGWNVWPTLTALWYEENAYYGNPNFLGPLQPSGDDKFMRLTLGGKKRFGSGYITVLADSTPFANFAVYQPGTPKLILNLRQIKLFPAIYPFIPLLLILCGLALKFRKSFPLLMVPLIGVAIPIHFGPLALNWGTNVQVWSGEQSLVVDQRNPEHSFSTAFTIAALSGKKPMWTDHFTEDQYGVWVGKKPPPNSNWKWLNPDVDDSAKVQNGDPAYQELLNYLGAHYPLGWEQIMCDRRCPFEVNAEHIWTNDVMGDWWFDRGLSPSRTTRFQSFLSWLNDQNLPEITKPAKASKTSISWLVKKGPEGKTKQIMEFPMPICEDCLEKPILLGRGMSVQVIKDDNSLILIGIKSFNEAWGSPEVWVAEKQGSKRSD